MERKCMIIGASPDTDMNTVLKYCKDCDIICADGGQNTALAACIEPMLIAGDFDSSDYPSVKSCELIKLPTKKDDTDTMYCIKEALKRGYDKYILVGMTGGRADHTYANYCSLLYLKRHGKNAFAADKYCETMILSQETVVFRKRKGAVFSIFPFGCEKCCVSLEGMEYGLDKGWLTVDFPLGVSNIIESDVAEVTVHDGTALVITGV